MPYEATLGDVSATTAASQCFVEPVTLQEAHQLGDNAISVRGVRRVAPRRPEHRGKDPSGHGQPPRRRRRRVTRQGRSVRGGPAKRVDTATTVASLRLRIPNLLVLPCHGNQFTGFRFAFSLIDVRYGIDGKLDDRSKVIFAYLTAVTAAFPG